MLPGPLLKVRFHRGRVQPSYLDVRDPDWQAAAEEFIDLYRRAVSRSRAEVASEVEDLIAARRDARVLKGLANLLEARCVYETVAERPPADVRAAVFRIAAQHRAAARVGAMPFRRDAVLTEAAAELSLPVDRVEAILFADLRNEQRILRFEEITATSLLARYNLALAQAVLLRSDRVAVRVRGETAESYQRLFRAIRFQRLIAAITPEPQNANPLAYRINLDGPLSLPTAVRQYGVNLAGFLPVLMRCQWFELIAELLWGAARRPARFELNSAVGLSDLGLTDLGLRSSQAEDAVDPPKAFAAFAASFRQSVTDFVLHDDPQPLPLSGRLWVPDFTLTHKPSGQVVYLELVGYWRAADLEPHAAWLNRHLPNRFLLAVALPLCVDHPLPRAWPPGVVPYHGSLHARLIAPAARQLLA